MDVDSLGLAESLQRTRDRIAMLVTGIRWLLLEEREMSLKSLLHRDVVREEEDSALELWLLETAINIQMEDHTFLNAVIVDARNFLEREAEKLNIDRGSANVENEEVVLRYFAQLYYKYMDDE